MKLAIITTHPIQYQVPIWQSLAKRNKVPFEVWYLTAHGTEPSFDRQFGTTFKWDLNLLDGYSYIIPEGVPRSLGSPLDPLKVALPLVQARRLMSDDIGAVLITGWQVLAMWEAVLLAGIKKLPVWIRAESHDLPGRNRSATKRLVRQATLAALFAGISRFLYVGQANRQLYESYGVTRDKLASAPYGVDTARLAEQAREARMDRNTHRENWGIPTGAFCVMFAGKFIHRKRAGDIIAAAVLLREKGLRIHLLFIGTGELEAELKSRCNVVYDAGTSRSAKTNELPTASFLGFMNQTEITRAYTAADVLILPSEYEPWGLVVNEALACGLPAIAADACGCSAELVRPLGLNYQVGDVSALAEAIRSVMNSPPSAQQLKMLSDAHDLSHSVEAIEESWLRG